MASNVQIAKLGLQHLGDRYDIASLSESSVEAEQVNLVFEPTRDYVLRSHPWGFAKKYVSLSALVADAPGGWDYQYTYPPDCLKIRMLRNPYSKSVLDRYPYEVSLNDSDAKVILTDVQNAELVYTKAVTDPNLFDSVFIMALSYALASRVAMALTGNPELARSMWDMMMGEMANAEVEDSTERTEVAMPEATWIAARA